MMFGIFETVSKFDTEYLDFADPLIEDYDIVMTEEQCIEKFESAYNRL